MSTQKKSKPEVKPVEATDEVVAETVEQAIEATREQVEKAGAAAVAGYEDFAAIQKESMEAFVQSGTVLAKGFEALGKEYLAFAQEAAEASSKVATALMTAKSIQEMVELQSEFARTNFDKSVNETGKLSEMSLKIANEAFEPVQKQFTVAVEAAMKPLAA